MLSELQATPTVGECNVHIAVLAKQVPDPNIAAGVVGVSTDGRAVDLPAGTTPVMNGYDANAVEEAVRLKELHGGTVTVVSLGDISAKNVLRRALAMGCDAAVHVEANEKILADSASTAQYIAQTIVSLTKVDVILCGRQASDSDAGQVLFEVAERLGIPALSPIIRIADVSAESLTVDRLDDDRIQRIRSRLPVVIGVSNEINKPRVVALKGMIQAKRMQIPTWTAVDLNIGDTAPAVVRLKVGKPPRRHTQVEIVSGASPAEIGRNLADKLFEAGLIQ